MSSIPQNTQLLENDSKREMTDPVHLPTNIDSTHTHHIGSSTHSSVQYISSKSVPQLSSIVTNPSSSISISSSSIVDPSLPNHPISSKSLSSLSSHSLSLSPTSSSHSHESKSSSSSSSTARHVVICIKDLKSLPVRKNEFDRSKVQHRRIIRGRLLNMINNVCPMILDKDKPLAVGHYIWYRNPRSLFNGWLLDLWNVDESNIPLIIEAVRRSDPIHKWSIEDNGLGRAKKIYGFLKANPLNDSVSLSDSDVKSWAIHNGLTSFELGKRIRLHDYDDSLSESSRVAVTFTISHVEYDLLSKVSQQISNGFISYHFYRYQSPEFMVCHKCHHQGHLMKDCSTRIADRLCGQCHNHHDMNRYKLNCPYNSDNDRSIICKYCKGNHISNDCDKIKMYIPWNPIAILNRKKRLHRQRKASVTAKADHVESVVSVASEKPTLPNTLQHATRPTYAQVAAGFISLTDRVNKLELIVSQLQSQLLVEQKKISDNLTSSPFYCPSLTPPSPPSPSSVESVESTDDNVGSPVHPNNNRKRHHESPPIDNHTNSPLSIPTATKVSKQLSSDSIHQISSLSLSSKNKQQSTDRHK